MLSIKYDYNSQPPHLCSSMVGQPGIIVGPLILPFGLSPCYSFEYRSPSGFYLLAPALQMGERYLIG